MPAPLPLAWLMLGIGLRRIGAPAAAPSSAPAAPAAGAAGKPRPRKPAAASLRRRPTVKD